MLYGNGLHLQDLQHDSGPEREPLHQHAVISNVQWTKFSVTLRSLKQWADANGESSAAFGYGSCIMEISRLAAVIPAMDDGVNIEAWKHPTCNGMDSYDADMQKAFAVGVLSDFSSLREAAAIAIGYLRRAAAAGDGDAAHNLGVAFSDGLLVPEDQQVARNWFQVAAIYPTDIGNEANNALKSLLTHVSRWRLVSQALRTSMHPLPSVAS